MFYYSVPGLQIEAPHVEGAESVLTPRGPRVPRRPRAALPARARPPPGAPRRAPGAPRRRRAARLPPRDRGDPRRRLEGRAAAGRPPGPPRRDHRPGRPQDGHQRAQLRRVLLHGRLRGRHHADLGQPGRGPAQPRATRSAGRSTSSDPASGKAYRLNERRPSSWSARAAGTCPRSHMLVDGEPMSGSLFDFGLYVFHNAKALLRRGTGPYFYLPKLESHLEARLWNDVFVHCAGHARRPAGHDQGHGPDRDHPRHLRDRRDPLRAREHSAGLNCGRWDYIFSFIKKLRERPQRRPAGPRAGHDDRALHARLQPARDQDLPPPRLPRRWAAWRRRSRSRTTPPPTRRRWPRSAPTRSARPATAMTAPGSPTRPWSRSPRRSSTALMPRPEPDRPRKRDDVHGHGRRPAGRVPDGTITEAGPAPPTSMSASATSRPGCAASAACRSTT